MAYDEGLAQRIREVIDERPGVVEKKMFGGLAFMVQGHMAFGIARGELMVKVGKEDWASSMTEPDAREMDFTGRSIKSMVYVDGDAIDNEDRLAFWVEKGWAHATSLPSK